jgi:hypothetical protein
MVRLLILLSKFLKELMLQNLRGSLTFIWVVDKHLHDDVLGISGNVRYKLSYTHKLFGLEVEFHVCRMLLEMI